MEYCSACQKAPATIVIMDLDGGRITDQQHLCGPCAQSLNIVQPKHTDKMSAELLEDLLGVMKAPTSTADERRALSDCPGCGLSLQKFRTTGRLGCPRCYQTFRKELLPLLQRVHESTGHCGRLPGGTGSARPSGSPPGLDSTGFGEGRTAESSASSSGRPGGATPSSGTPGSATPGSATSGSATPSSDGEDLESVLEAHDASDRAAAHAAANAAAEAAEAKALVDLRQRLEEAIRSEHYEEAARLRDQLRRAENGARPDSSARSGSSGGTSSPGIPDSPQNPGPGPTGSNEA